MLIMTRRITFNRLYKNIVEGGYDFGTGSWAVVTPKIKMKMNENGEYHPFVSKEDEYFSERELKELKESCVSSSEKNESDIAKMLFSDIPNMKYDQRLGYYLGLYAGHVNEGNFRNNGSSGGFGTWIFKELLLRGNIDGVIHVTSSEENDKLFGYNISNTLDEILSGSKTKYYPVEYSEVINKIKEIPGKYAIIGLPSYIMEIRLLSEIDPVIKERIKFCIGLVCGHQKSANFAEFLAWQCGIEPGKLQSIDFRKKLSGSPANEYAIEVTGVINGERHTIVRKMKDLVGGDWGQGPFKVSASDFTDDVMNETADVTLGDAWLPEYTQDSSGNNIIVVRNPVIKSIIECGIASHRVSVDEVDEDTIYKSQEGHYKHTYNELKYRLYKKERARQWHPKKRVNPSNNLSWSRKRIQDMRERICLKVPIIYVKARKRHDLNYVMKRLKSMSKGYERIYLIGAVIVKIKNLCKD